MPAALAKQTEKRRGFLGTRETREEEEKAESETGREQRSEGKEGCGKRGELFQYYCKRLNSILNFIDGQHIH